MNKNWVKNEPNWVKKTKLSEKWLDFGKLGHLRIILLCQSDNNYNSSCYYARDTSFKWVLERRRNGQKVENAKFKQKRTKMKVITCPLWQELCFFQVQCKVRVYQRQSLGVNTRCLVQIEWNLSKKLTKKNNGKENMIEKISFMKKLNI